jgi:hypothetical protein
MYLDETDHGSDVRRPSDDVRHARPPHRRAALTARESPISARRSCWGGGGATPGRPAIESEELNYDPEANRIWSDVFTRMRHPDGGSTTFQTFSTDDKFQNMTGTGMTGRIPGLKL